MITKIVYRPETFLVAAALIISLLAHSLNMFKYPYYEDDEGTYMSQAWSLVTQRQLAPYTYTYDHAPAGWMLIAAWTYLTGGFFTFGTSVNSGRVLMLIFQVFSTFLVYLIARRLTQKPLIAFMTALIFALSPLGIYFHRRVLLDNMMTFWFLLSFAILLFSSRRLLLLFLSGLAFGIAIVTKEVALIFTPILWYLILHNSSTSRVTRLLVWTLAFLLPVIIYCLYAVSRGEFFAYGMPFGGKFPHISLIGTWIDQIKRPGGNLLWTSLLNWYHADPVIITLGFITTVINLFLGLTNFPSRIISLLSLLFTIFLFRGGLVLEFYIIPLIPLLALNIAISLWQVNTMFALYFDGNSLINTSRMGIYFFTLALLVFDFSYFSRHSKGNLNFYTSNQTEPQVSTINWILSHPNPVAVYAIDNYAYVDLHSAPVNTFKRADYYWKIDKDPKITNTIIKNDWRNIDFVVLTPQMKSDINNPTNGLVITLSAQKAGRSIETFAHDGWGVEIFQVQK